MTQPKLLALIDGSSYAQSVCDYSVWAARALSIPVELMHVMGRRQENALDISGALSLGARTRMLEDMARIEGDLARHLQDRGRALIEDAADHLEAALKLRPTARLRTGDLVLEANQALNDTDLLIIGKRGEAAEFAKLHLGSNLERMIRSCRCPILVAPRSFQPLGRVLVAYDGRSSSKRAVSAMAESTLLKGLPITLMTVRERDSGNSTSLDEPTTILEQAGFEVYAETLSGKAVEVIRNRVASEEFSLMVMGAYSGNRLHSMLIGSTTTELLISCRIPALLYR